MDVYLEKLELHGFKSFPEKTVLKFHKGITAVVGPNGCGKSNIVDAILWVLGEQRIKNLRGENNEDLIFNGSVSKKPLGMTEVGSYFMNQGEQVYISRRFFRSGESKYILNEKYCRNKDIQDALFNMQMGDKKYFIFEQGSIDRLISLKPSEKRLLIEEAAGISQYLERKRETTNKLIIAEQNLENIEILSADKNNRLKELKNQANYVGRFRKLKADRNNCLKTLLKKQFQSYQKDFNHFKSEIEELINQEAILVKDISAMEKKDIQLEEKMWLIDKELKEKQQDIFNTNRTILSRDNEIEKSQQKNEFDQQKIIEKKEALKNNETESNTIIENHENEVMKIAEIEEKLKIERSGNQKQISELTRLKESIAVLSTEEASIKQEIFNIQAEKSQLTNQILDMENKNGRIQNEIDSKKKFIDELTKQINLQEIDQIQNELDNINKKIREKESNFKQIQQEEMKSRERKEILEQEQRNLENEINNLKNQQIKYTEIKKNIIGSENGAARITGTGLLQDTIEVKKEYHQIIETFYFDELDAVPVNQKNDLTTFKSNKYMISREKKSIPGEIQKENGFIAFVKDLFSPGDKSLNRYLKNGILADNLQNGIDIYKKFGVNVVTRNAEIINKDGVLIKKRGKGILNVIDEIRKIDRKKTEMTAKLATTNQALKLAKDERENLPEKVEKEKTELASLKEKELLLNATLKELRKNKDTYLQRININESEVELLLIEIEKNRPEWKKHKQNEQKLENKYRELVKKQSAIQDQVHQLEEKINQTEKNSLQQENSINLLEEKLLSHKNKKQELENRKSRLSSSNQVYLQEIKKLENNLSETTQKIKDLRLSIQTLEQNKQEMEKQIKKQEMEFERLSNDIKSNTARLKQKRNALDEIKERKNKLEIDFSAIKKDLFQLNELAFKELNTELDQIEEDQELKCMEIAKLKNEFESTNEKMLKMRDSDRLNFSAESEYEILAKDYNFLVTQKSDIKNSIQNLNDAIKKIDQESQSSFLEAFNEIKKNYRKNFQILFEGGEAELRLSDETNITETGLEIEAQPPGKKLQSLRLLSGGEKALASLAFLFALFEYKPSPFCVFDEVDAALDEANIKRFLKFVHKLKEKTQFLIITHNFKTMEEADYIYGITMNTPGISTIYSMKMTGKNQLIPER
ncbi:MAG: chromosome segregation protein SMC [Candidatus Aminicenantes bacterium]|nr:chromosome segregation protein SMC [Candidatus Aminicenantes bacterium]